MQTTPSTTPTASSTHPQQPVREEPPRQGPLEISKAAPTSPWFASPWGSPFESMMRWMSDIDRALGFGPLVPSLGVAPAQPDRAGTFRPHLDVLEAKGELLVRVDLPGVPLEAIEVSIDDDRLVIAGSRDERAEAQAAEMRHAERGRGGFRRIVMLPHGVDPAAIAARYENGVLEVHVPLPASVTAAPGRKIAINAPGQHPQTVGKSAAS